MSSGRKTIHRLMNVHRHYEGGTPRGWLVKLKRKGRSLCRYFGDGRHGGPEAARLEALRYRDRMLGKLPPPVRLQRWHSRSTTGVVGVTRQRHRTPSGRTYWRYVARWRPGSGRYGYRSFSVVKFGESRARELAVAARREAVAQILRNEKAALRELLRSRSWLAAGRREQAPADGRSRRPGLRL